MSTLVYSTLTNPVYFCALIDISVQHRTGSTPLENVYVGTTELLWIKIAIQNNLTYCYS